MQLRRDLQAIGWLAAFGLLVLAAIPFMPRGWFASPISEEPRSMMNSGFINDHPDVGPWTWWWSDQLPLRVDHPDDTNIVIWNHHTEGQVGAPSCMGSHYFPPPAIARLERIGRTRVYYLCTDSTQEPDKPFYALQRRDEILGLVAKFRALGVPPGRIFLAGQSGGSCSSLYALGAAPEAMNAGILFAPACFGPGEGVLRRLGSDAPERRALIAEMVGAERITGLVVAFHRDLWNKPRDLGFLLAPHDATLRLFTPGCGADHGGAFHGCGVGRVSEAVRDYFLERLVAAGHPLPAGVAPPPALVETRDDEPAGTGTPRQHAGETASPEKGALR